MKTDIKIKKGICLLWKSNSTPGGFLIEKIIKIDYKQKKFDTMVIDSDFPALIGNTYNNAFSDIKIFKGIVSEDEVILRKL